MAEEVVMGGVTIQSLRLFCFCSDETLEFRNTMTLKKTKSEYICAPFERRTGSSVG